MSNLTIQQAVAEKIKSSGPKVEELIIDKLANHEIQNRVESIIKAQSKITELDKEIRKTDKPDNKSYPVGGGDPIETQSEAVFKKVKELKEKHTKLIKLTDDALELNTADAYAKLNNELK